MESGDDCCLNHSRAAASTRLDPINVTTPGRLMRAFLAALLTLAVVDAGESPGSGWPWAWGQD